MIKLLLGLDVVPAPHDAADALAVAICHVHSSFGAIAEATRRLPTTPSHGGGLGRRSPGGGGRHPASWRDYRP
jgi:hypothetical protein